MIDFTNQNQFLTIRARSLMITKFKKLILKIQKKIPPIETFLEILHNRIFLVESLKFSEK